MKLNVENLLINPDKYVKNIENMLSCKKAEIIEEPVEVVEVVEPKPIVVEEPEPVVESYDVKPEYDSECEEEGTETIIIEWCEMRFDLNGLLINPETLVKNIEKMVYKRPVENVADPSDDEMFDD